MGSHPGGFRPRVSSPNRNAIPLARAATYTLTFQDRTNLNCQKTGKELMDEGIKVTGMTGDEASEIIWIKKN